MTSLALVQIVVPAAKAGRQSIEAMHIQRNAV
jgi:hypothetical protein